jgi:hypothetical protein
LTSFFSLFSLHISYLFFLRGILVNKPGASDGSEDQLTAGAETCYLIRTQSPDLNPVPGVTQSFAAFRTYKDRIPVFLRVPSDGAVLKVLENLIVFVDEVNDRPVGNPKSKV